MDNHVPEFPPLVVSSQKDWDNCDFCCRVVLRGHGRSAIYDGKWQVVCDECVRTKPRSALLGSY